MENQQIFYKGRADKIDEGIQHLLSVYGKDITIAQVLFDLRACKRPLPSFLFSLFHTGSNLNTGKVTPLFHSGTDVDLYELLAKSSNCNILPKLAPKFPDIRQSCGLDGFAARQLKNGNNDL